MLPAEARRRAQSASAPSSAPANRQREPRLALLRTAQLESLGGSNDVRIRNISARGAMVEAPGNISIGLDATLRLADGWAFTGEVRWRRGNRLGIAFDAPIALDDFVMGLAPPQPAKTIEPAEAPVPDWLQRAAEQRRSA
ncbi:MAG: PilZ domain-containing protein [Sphingopyxis sp.]|nr:PilZ domain-containing protein [Sphingopyxis sp.]